MNHFRAFGPSAGVIAPPKCHCAAAQQLECRTKHGTQGQRPVRAFERLIQHIAEKFGVGQQDEPRYVLRVIRIEREPVPQRSDRATCIAVEQPRHSKHEMAEGKAWIEIDRALRRQRTVLAEPA